jgi:ABC-type nitrate/sulfonate/bicarbonate transport system permease component
VAPAAPLEARPLNTVVRASSRVVPILVLFAAWEVLTRVGLIGTQILPSFSAVCVAGADLLASGTLVQHLFVSLYRALGGLALSIVVGVSLGVGMARNRHVANFFDPLVSLVYPLPKTALVPLTMVWLGVTDRAAILVIFLAGLLPIVVNTYHGVRNVDRVLLWSARSLGTPARGLFRRVVIPAAMPYIFNGVRIALPVSFIVVISVELVASKVGVGNLINGYGGLGIYDYMFATILLFVVVAFVADRCAVRVGTGILRWHEERDAH